MSYNDSIAIRAGADLSGSQYLCIEIDGTIGGSVVGAVGILDNKPGSGEDATVVYAGRQKFTAGAAVTAGTPLNVNSDGYCVDAASGDPTCGRCEIAANSGSVTYGLFNFASVGIAAE